MSNTSQAPDLQPKRWSQMEERCSTLGVKTLLMLFKLGGRPLMSFCLYFVVCFYFLVSHKARHYSLEYLRQLHSFMGAKSPWKKTPNLWQSFQHFLSFANALVDKCIVWMGHYKSESLHFTGYEYHDKIQKSGQGALILISHLGNIEVCRAIGAFKGVSLTILAHDKQTPEFHRVLTEIAGASPNIDVVQVTNVDSVLAMQLQEKLNNGGYIAIAGDRIPVEENGRCETVPFLGRDARFAQGPLMLASLFKCPILLLFCMKEKHGYHVYFEPFSDGLNIPRKERKEKLKQEIKRFAERLEYYTCLYPLQWYNFFSFWENESNHKSND